MDSSVFKNKVIWIVGASSGVGYALAKQLDRCGAKLIISSRREQVLKNISAELQNSLVIPCDVSHCQREDVQQMLNKIIDKYGKLDYLFLNAGVSQRYNVHENQEIDIDRKIMETNFLGLVQITKVVLPYFQKQAAGHFVVTSSVMGKFGYPGRATYCASKHAIQGYFDALRLELKSLPIYVTLLVLGAIDTLIGVNSITADGERFSRKGAFQENAMPAQTCVRKILKAVESRKAEVVIGGKEISAVYIKRFFPNMLNRILSKQPVET
jgi:dehydrogenase/reductase SDR family protein 7B